MKRRNIILILMFLIIGTSMAYAEEIENLFDNPGFEEGKAKEAQSVPGWKVYMQGTATATFTLDTEDPIEGKQCLFVDIESIPGGNTWDLRVDHSRRFHVKKGKTYTMPFWLKGDGPREIELSPSRAEQNEAGQWGNLASKVVNITEEWKEYYLTFVSSEDRLIMWQLLVGHMKGDFWVDHARCYEGEYVEDEIKPPKIAVLPSGKLTTQWGHLKSRRRSP